MLSSAYSISLTQIYPNYLGLRCWGSGVTCGVKMMSLCHGRGWHSNCSLIPCLTYTKCLSTLICCSSAYGSSLTLLYPHYFCPDCGMLGSLVLVESKWCHYVMVVADSHLKLLPTSILDILQCLSILICCTLVYGSSLKQLVYPHYLAQILGCWGHLWSQNDVITS
jgi:hypothetical protein